jgi:hypothetical protein
MTALKATIGVFVLAALGLFYTQPRFAGAKKINLAKQVIVAERASKAGVRILLAVDQDDAVREIDTGLSDTDGGPTIQASFGARVTVSGNLKLANVLPKNEIAVQARRTTLESGVVMHVVLAWGFSQFPDILSPVCWLHVFREGNGDTAQILASELGPQLEQFVVEDINSDGKVEILVATRENAVASMDIWQLQPDSGIKKIQRIDGYNVHTQVDRFVGPDEGIIVERKRRVDSGARCFDVDNYLWSEKQQRFVKE